MIAVDTNVLVYALREDSEWHLAANERLVALAESRATWTIPWPCLHEFLAIVTHPKIFTPPTPLARAVDQVDAWIESPSLVLLTESEVHCQRMRVAAERKGCGSEGPRRAHRGALPAAWCA